MNKQERISFIIKTLDDFFPEPEIPLSHTSPFTLLIAVLLSAQCTDLRVNMITPLLFAKANTPFAMAKLSIEEIQEIIRPCGLSNMKAKAIHQLSKLLLEEYEGLVPSSFEALEQLPGVGHKTASVVMTQAFQKPAFPVDTHIHRCALRWGLSDGRNVKKTEQDLKQIFPEDSWGKIHLQIIYFARKFCPAKKHIISQCPICSVISK
ncbi:Endonuclease III [Candidatus Rubidus massiliensis]|nr:Endonuclease III [Candidatus Rubidus massiliensis]